MARRVLRATREQEVERVLAVGRHPLQDRHVERRRAVQDRDPDVVGVLAQVVLGEGPAIRGAVQVDRVVPEGRPDVVEVVGRDGARVEARVRIERREGSRASTPRDAPRPRTADRPDVSGSATAA